MNKHTKGTYIWRDIGTEGTRTRNDAHTEGHIHGGNIHMEEQPNKESSTRREHAHRADIYTKETYTRRRHTNGGNIQMEGHTHGGDIQMEGTYIWRDICCTPVVDNPHPWIKEFSMDVRKCWSEPCNRLMEKFHDWNG